MTTSVVVYDPFQPTGFVPDPDLVEEMTYEMWAGYLTATMTTWEKMRNAMPWWLGDLINMGEAKYGEKYAQVVEVTGVPVEQLANYANVARKVSFRNENLSWSHHKHVAPLEPSEQREWLDTAEAEGWTSSELRDHLKGARRKVLEPKGPAEVGLGSESAGPESGLDDEVDVDEIAPVEVHERVPEGEFMKRPIRYVIQSDIEGLRVYGSEELLLALANVVEG